LFKNLFVLLGVVGLTACAGVGDSAVTFMKTGEVAGTAGLNVAAKKCASLEGAREWQECVAHYDGLYTMSNGTIKRSYAISSDAPKPTGQIEKCDIKATLDSKTGTWSYSSCESPK
jgi:hypothetical protein